jgi:hypothetical protein
MRKTLLLALSSVAAVNRVSSFGFRMENNNAQSQQGSSSSTVLHASSSSDEEAAAEAKRYYSRRLIDLERTYTLHSSYDDEHDTFDLNNRAGEDVLSDEALFSGLAHYQQSIEAEENSCGEDCQECMIPEEFKIQPDDQGIDVMAFLGIKRAVPLRTDQAASTVQPDTEFE